MEISRVSPSDKENLLALMVKVISETPYYNEATKKENTQFYIKGFKSDLLNNPKHLFLIAKEGNQLIAFCHGWHEGKDDATFYLAWLGVDKDYRRKSCASKLFIYLEDLLRMRGVKKIGILVLDHNTESRSFFDKFGFKSVKSQKILEQDYQILVKPLEPYFAGKKITLMGLGLLGRGIGDAKFLAEQGADLIVTDLKSAEQLKSSLAKLKKFPAVKFTLGEHKLEDFRARDLVIKTANVPLNSPHVAEALKTGGRVTTSVGLFAKLAAEKGAKLIGVTGTRGKSTTTELIYEMIKASGQPVHLGGNVRGLSTLSLLPKIKPGDWVVLELDSWQLQGFGAEKLSPQIAVFTNFMDDHLNYYAGDRQQYFADKANIYKWQRPGDHLIVGSKLKIPDRPGVRARAADVPAGWKLKLLGEHNRENLGLAITAAELAGVKPAVIKKVAQTFPGMPGRLEWRRTWRGIKIYNDTTSTTPDALEAGLKAMGQKAILIMGGADKNLPLEVLAARLPGLTKKVFMLPGTGTDKFKVQLTKAKKFAEVQSLKEGFQKALAEAKKGDVILFSPGFASFGLFKNEFDRGDQFNDLVAALP